MTPLHLADGRTVLVADTGPGTGSTTVLAWAATAGSDPAQFTDADWAALDGEWSALGQDAQAANETGRAGSADDDRAFVTGWGFALADVDVPTLVEQGVDDRVVPLAHGRMIAAAVPGAVLHERPGDGHVSVSAGVLAALDWLTARS
jgi:pimeloyl-ACP methyl ester carboxylesterase